MIATMIGNETTEMEAQSVNTVKAISILPEYATDISEYIDRVEYECEKYAFIRKNLGEKMF